MGGNVRISTEVRRQQLIDATVAVLMRDGVAKASLRNIAAEAGASLAAVHVCFKNKDELLSGAFEGFLDETWLSIDSPADPTLGLRGASHRILDGFWTALLLKPFWVIAQFEVEMWSLRQRGHHDIIRQVYIRYEERIAQILEVAVRASGEMPVVPLSRVARGIVAITDGCGLQQLAEPISTAHRELADMMLDSLIDRALPIAPEGN